MKPEDLKRIQEQIKTATSRVDELRGDIDRARLAGLDVSAQEAEYRNLQRNIDRLRIAYGV